MCVCVCVCVCACVCVCVRRSQVCGIDSRAQSPPLLVYSLGATADDS